MRVPGQIAEPNWEACANCALADTDGSCTQSDNVGGVRVVMGAIVCTDYKERKRAPKEKKERR